VERKPVIAVVGAGRNIEAAVLSARELGRLIADNGWVLITGGRDAGVMEAANKGAKEAKDSLTIGILPYPAADVSSSVDVAIVTDMGQARNNIIVLSADIVIASGIDGAGTASEVALAIKNGKQVILLDVDDKAREFFSGIDLDRVKVADSPKEAIEMARVLLRARGAEE